MTNKRLLALLTVLVLLTGSLFAISALGDVVRRGGTVTISREEYERLKLMMEHKGTTLKKDYLFNTVWGSDSDSELQTLTVHIKWLREKIEKDPKKPAHILTVWGVGYRFEA